MKLKTIFSSEKRKWHKHFLWIPKRVRMTKEIDIWEWNIEIESELSVLWLEYVQRRYVWKWVITDNNDDFFYWTRL